VEVARTADVHITIGAAPSGQLSLENELRLVKPALLYADHVTLYSPTTSMLAMTAAFGELSEDQKLEFLRQVAPTVSPSDAPNLVAVLDVYEALRSKRRRSRDEIVLVEKVRRQLDAAWVELRSKVDEILSGSGVEELLPAIEQGLLDIDPIVSGEDFDSELFLQEFVNRLFRSLLSPTAYPLFDDASGALVRAHVAEGLIEPLPASDSRARQVAAAASFMSRLPAFSAATLAEVLDVRKALSGPLVRFRAGVVEISELLTSRAFEEGFDAEVEQAYIQHIAPPLQEIEELVAANTYLRQLLGKTVADMKTTVTAVLTLGITRVADLPALIAGGAALLTAAASAALAKSEEAQRIRQERFLFLYRTQELLA